MPAATDLTQYPSMQPCCGALSQIKSAFTGEIADELPVAAFLLSQGGGTTVNACNSSSGEASLFTMTLTNADQWGVADQRGYQAALVSHAANSRRGVIADSDGFRPTDGIFSAAMLIEVAASYTTGQGFFEKNDGSDGNGYGIYWDSGDLVAWVNDPLGAGVVSLTPNATGWQAGRYALLVLVSDGAKVWLHLTTSQGTQSVSADYVATSLATATESLYVGSNRTGGTGCINGALVSFTFWPVALSEEALLNLAADPFCMFTFPRDVTTCIVPITIPVGVGAGAVELGRIGVDIDAGYNPASDWTVFLLPGTPTGTFNGQQWIDSTLGATSTGSDPSTVLAFNRGGGPTWRQAFSAKGASGARVAILSDMNGNGSWLGNGSQSNNYVCRQRLDAAIAYFNGIVSAPLGTGNRSRMALQGFSATAQLAKDIALARATTFSRAITMHGVMFQDLAGSADIAIPNTNCNSYNNNGRNYTTPPAWTWGDPITSGSNPASATQIAAYANGGTFNWQTDANAPTVEVLVVGGTSATDRAGTTMTTPGEMYALNAAYIDLMRATNAAYVNIRQVLYTSGINANHVQGDDVSVAFLLGGFPAIFTQPTIISDEDGLVG